MCSPYVLGVLPLCACLPCPFSLLQNLHAPGRATSQRGLRPRVKEAGINLYVLPPPSTYPQAAHRSAQHSTAQHNTAWPPLKKNSASKIQLHFARFRVFPVRCTVAPEQIQILYLQRPAGSRPGAKPPKSQTSIIATAENSRTLLQQ